MLREGSVASGYVAEAERSGAGVGQRDLPPGVLDVVTCSRPSVEAVGDAMLGHRAVKRLSFTGSTRVGRAIGVKAMQRMIRPVLELGGKDPVIVLEGTDLDQAVRAVAFGCFFHQGQICMSTERVIVQSSIAQAFTEKLVRKAKSMRVGDPADPATQLGPIIHQGQLKEIHAQVKEAIADGAELLCGGEPWGLFYPPTVLGRVTRRMRIAREETFGPVAPILVVRDADEAVEVANDSEYGLSAGIFLDQTGRHAVGPGIARDRRGNVAIGVRIAMEDPAQDRTHEVEVPQVDAADQRVRRPVEVQREHRAAP